MLRFKKDMELKDYYQNTKLIWGRTLTALYMLDEHRCVLIDNGFSSEWPQLQDLLQKNNLVPAAILCTHMHIDHHGNSKNLRSTYNAPLYMPAGEAGICSSQVGLYQYMHSYARSKAFVADITENLLCPVDYVIEHNETELHIEGKTFRVLHLPGHCHDHCAYITPDGVAFTGDLLLSDNILSASHMPFTNDWAADRQSKLDLLKLDCSRWIFSHKGTHTGSIQPVVKRHVELMDSLLLECCSQVVDPCSRSEWEQRCRKLLGMNGTNVQHMLLHERHFRPYIEELILRSWVEPLARDSMLIYAATEAGMQALTLNGYTINDQKS